MKTEKIVFENSENNFVKKKKKLRLSGKEVWCQVTKVTATSALAAAVSVGE